MIKGCPWSRQSDQGSYYNIVFATMVKVFKREFEKNAEM